MIEAAQRELAASKESSMSAYKEKMPINGIKSTRYLSTRDMAYALDNPIYATKATLHLSKRLNNAAELEISPGRTAEQLAIITREIRKV
jgi:hypothetical protein